MEQATKPSNYDYADHEGEGIVKQLFTPTDLKMSPEEYAARHAQDWGCFSFHLYQYRDPALGTWMRRLGEIFMTEGEVERCRLRYLTAAELAAVRKRAADEF